MKDSLGVVYGTSSSSNFEFIVTSDESVQGTDYVKAWHPDGNWVLARVTEVHRKNDSQSLEDLSIDASDEVVKATALTIGRRDEHGVLRPPRSPLSPGNKVYPADTELVEDVLGLTDGSLYIGKLEHLDVPVKLDANELVKKHCSILARTGSGKSYAAGVLMEELMEHDVPLLIIDPHGEYSSLRKANSRKKERKHMDRYDVSPKGFPQVKVFSPDPEVEGETFRMNGLNLSPQELSELVPTKLTNSQLGILYKTVKELKEEHRDYTVDDIIERAEDNRSDAKWNLINALEYLQNLDILSASPTPITELVRDGRCSVLDMRGVDPELQEIIVARTARKVFAARKAGDVPPLMMFVEEAHNFIPERGLGKAASSEVMMTVASEGRKFGLGMCVISQRPAKIDKNVLSQCNTQIILKVTNSNDLKALASGVEGLTSDMEREISRLPSGVALLVSTNIERPVLVDVRVRKSLHGDGGLTIAPDTKPGGKRKKKKRNKKKKRTKGAGTTTAAPTTTPGMADGAGEESEGESESIIGKLFKKKK